MISKLVQSLTKPQLLDILSEMKKFSTQNPEGARQLLTDSPQVAQTLLQILILFGLVRPQDVASIQTLQRPSAGSMPAMQLPHLQQQAPLDAAAAAAQAASAYPAPLPPMAMGGAYAPLQPLPMHLAPAPLAPVPQQLQPPPQPQPQQQAAFSEEDKFMLGEIMKLSPDQIMQLPQEVQDKIRLLQQQLEGQAR